MKHEIDLEQELTQVYEEIMWLAKRPNITPSVARSWYTHATAERLKRYTRMFTGYVSEKAIEELTELRLEHYLRIQTTLTQLVKKHITQNIYDPLEFVAVIKKCEQVNIVTAAENYQAMKAKGDYKTAGIKLIHWNEINSSKKAELWKTMLRGKVANFKDYNF